MPVHNPEQCRRILERYHTKVNQPNYTYRKRGNPPELINAVAVLRSGKVCAVCKSLEGPELHHVDGNWRNNTLGNLKFYCHECHKQTHKEMKMSNKRTIWTTERVNELRADVEKLVAFGSTKQDAYKALHSKWKIAPDFMGKLCTSGIDKIRAGARKYNQQKRNLGSSVPAFSRHTPTNTNTGITMTAQEAMEFYMFLKRNSITIT